MMNLLADVMISGEWITTISVAVIGAIGAVWLKGRSSGKQEAQESSVSIADQPVHVSTEERPQWVTRQTFDEHVQRMEASIDEIKDSLDGERGIARVANGNLHKRLDALSEKFGDRLSNLEGTSKGVNETVNKLLDIALGKIKPRSGA